MYKESEEKICSASWGALAYSRTTKVGFILVLKIYVVTYDVSRDPSSGAGHVTWMG